MKNFSKIILIFFFLTAINEITAQTPGSLSFSFISLAQSSNHGTKHNLAVWIQKEDGSFVKTQFRFAGDLTRDHLPIWAANSGGPAADCLDPSCNTVSAVTGATLLDYGLKNFTWDGTDAAGVQVPDGIYKVMIEECWKHGVDGLTSRIYSFLKGPNSDIQSITSDTCFTNISLQWLPTNSLQENEESYLHVSSNPSQTGIFHLEFDSAEKIIVTNNTGQIIFSESFKPDPKMKDLDLSKFSSGLYYLTLINGNTSKVSTLNYIK